MNTEDASSGSRFWNVLIASPTTCRDTNPATLSKGVEKIPESNDADLLNR